MADNEVLRATTEIKIHELRRHDGELAKQYDAIDQELDTVRDVPVKRLHALYQGVNELKIVQERLHNDLKDLPDLLAFGAVDDNSVRGVLGLRAETIEREITCRRALWQHNKLLGQLLMETVDDDKIDEKEPGTTALDGEWTLEEATPPRATTGLEAQRQEAQKRIEDYFFVPCGLDRVDVRAFLETDVFQRRASYSDSQWEKLGTTLSKVRDEVATFGASFVNKRIEANDVAALARSLLVDKNEFSAEVVKLLENATQNAVVQTELAHVLTIKLSTLSEFQWPTQGVPVVMKRAINGRYRSLIQEGAIPFLLFQYIGLAWSIFIKKQLAKLLTCVDFERDEFYQSNSVNESRQQVRDRFLLSALPDAVDSSDNYDGDADASSTNAPALKTTKLDVLRLVCTEAHLANTLAGDEAQSSVLAVVTDLEFFGPSVSHEVVLGILAFLGVTDTWLHIFETHMKMPLRFPGSETPRVLAKGVPTSRRSSRFYSELVLFTMDFAVMATSGVFLYRTHDDILFFGPDDATVLSAWEAINTVTDRFGLKLNQEKSGSVRLCCAQQQNRDADVASSSYGPAPLPQKPIRWGLIELQCDASVQIVQDQVDWFAWELAQKLGKTTSVLRWITVYNKYMRFFLRNFGGVSPVFGLGHADSMIEQVKHIHRVVFPTTSGDVRAALVEKIEHNHADFMRENSVTLPAAWVYWPLDLGGLGLFHPLLELWSFKQTLVDEANYGATKWTRPFDGTRVRITHFYETFADKAARNGLGAAIQETFTNAANMFEIVESSEYSETRLPKGYNTSNWSGDVSGSLSQQDAATFALRSLPAFAQRLVKFDDFISRDYLYLLQPTNVRTHLSYSAACVTMRKQWGSVELPNATYWVWVVYVYHRELEHVFGTTSFVPSKLLPAQLIGEIQKAGIYWS